MKRATPIMVLGTLALTAAVAGLTQAQQAPQPTGAMPTITGLTEPSVTEKVGFDIRGVVSKLFVKKNDVVKAGQPLIALDDREERANLLYYKLSADTSLQVAEAEQTAAVKQIDYERKKKMFDQGNVATDFEVRTAEAERNIARIRVDQAKHEAAVAQARADAQQQRVDRMTRAPHIDGIVSDIVVHEGEQVDETKPVIEVVDLDPLYVQVTLVDTAVVQKLKLGDKVMVKYSDESKWREATVNAIDPSADRRSGKHPFRLSLPNPENRSAGLRVELQLPASAVADASR